jgi:RIO-like serine/threonine protein kinase
MFSKPARERELQFQQRAYELLPNHVPAIIDFNNGILTMERLEGASTIFELHGDQEEDVPDAIWDEIHRIVRILYEENIVYHDITSFNFMYNPATDVVYIVDFGHCSQEPDNYVEEFVYRHLKLWNADFK